MGVQYRGCSRLYYATITEAADGTLSFGTPTQIAPVKSVSRDISSDSEKIFADNVAQDVVYGANSVTRTFETIKIADEIQATLLGEALIQVGEVKAHATRADGSKKPYVAIGYALHDGDPDNPCLLVWSFKNKVNSISLSSNTIDDGTGSEGQSIEVQSFAPKKAWSTTSERNVDISLPIDSTNVAKVDDWFAQVVTPDNITTVMAQSE